MSNVSSSNSQGVRVPKLRFPGFEGEWENAKLSDLTIFLRTRGNACKSHFISTENMRQNCSGIEQYDDNSIANGIAFEKGDLLLANIRPYLKKLWISSFSGVCSTDVLAFHPIDVDSDFLYSSLCRDSFFTYVMSGAKGSKMPRGDKSHIMDFQFAVPNKQEQEKIASFVQQLDTRIEKQRQLVELLKLYKRGVSNRIFKDMYNSSWHTVCLGEICKITMGQSPDSSSYNTDGIGLPLVQGNADITNGITTPLRYTSSPTKTCENGAVILSVRAPVGTVSRANQRVCLGRGVCAITSSNTDFIYQLLLCYQESWKRIEQGGTFTAISGDDISSFSVSIPDCNLQEHIAVFLSQLDAKIRNEEKILKELQKQKSALLQQIFI